MDRADDRQIWAYAQSEAVTIVTHDADFAELAGLYGPPPKVIWLRSGNLPTDAVAAWLRRFAPEIVAFGQDELAACLELV
ncbi:MAG: hypothetical protein JWM33_1658 [Caulobacteraceae bacterium]|nr:hypothetical protein [Caulobacteraceae bacterium]